MPSPFLVYCGYSTSNTLAGFTLLKGIDYNKADLRVLVLPSKNFPLVLKLLISKNYNNKGSERLTEVKRMWIYVNMCSST